MGIERGGMLCFPRPGMLRDVLYRSGYQRLNVAWDEEYNGVAEGE